MGVERHERLRAFIEETLAATDTKPDTALADDTSLIESGLLDSLAILSLASWIDDEIGAEGLDLESVDFASEWDSIESILCFIDSG